jgi:hypothetical protein
MQTWRCCCGCGCIWCSSLDRETSSIGGVFETTAESKRGGTQTRDFGTRDFGLGMMQAYNPYEIYSLPHAENPLPDVPISASGYR